MDRMGRRAYREGRQMKPLKYVRSKFEAKRDEIAIKKYIANGGVVKLKVAARVIKMARNEARVQGVDLSHVSDAEIDAEMKRTLCLPELSDIRRELGICEN